MINNSEFPISGILKEPMLILEWLLFFLFLELSVLLLLKSKRNERKIRMVGETGYIFLFFGYTFMWMFIVIADYYISSEFVRLIILNVGFSIEVILAFIFILLVERKYTFIRKYFFSSIYFLLFLIYIIVLIFQISLGAFVSSLFWILFIIFISFYWKNLYRTYYVKIEVKKFQSDIIKFSLGIILVFIGYVFTTRFVVDQLSIIYRLLGDLLQILGSILLFFFFGSISSLSELFWKSEIDIIYVIHKSGLLITQKTFQKEEDYVQKSIDSGGITSLEMILENISNKGGISIIERKEKNLMIYPGNYIYTVLICGKIYSSQRLFAEKLTEKIEFLYENILKKWQGNLRVFSPLKQIIEDML